MKKTNKIILASIIAAIIISGFSIQNLLPMTILQADDNIKDDLNDNVAPNAAQEQVTYDWGGGRDMVIDADPDNNKTTTTINDGADSLPIYSELNETQAITIINNTHNINMNDTTTTLYNEDTGNKAEIDHTFTDNLMDITIPGEFYIHTEAVGDYNDKSLESCNVELYDVGNAAELNMTYERDDPDGYDLFVNLTDVTVNAQANFDYDDMNNEFLWNASAMVFGETPLMSDYQAIVNNSGVWINGIQRVDWLDSIFDTWTDFSFPPGFQAINVTEASVNVIVISYMFYAPGSIPMTPVYELIFTKSDPNNITMELVLTMGIALSIVWYGNLLSVISGIGAEALFVMFYLWYIASDKLYILILVDFEIEFHWFIIIIYVDWFVIEIWWMVNDIVYWTIRLLWIEWIIEILIGLDLNDVFSQYQIIIRHDFWTYIYHVPTWVMPNMLSIQIIESTYGETDFDFTIQVTDLWGSPVDGCEITGDWDDYPIQPGDVTATGGGQYKLLLPAKRIAPADPALWLNLTASSDAYANGTLNTQIAVFDQLFIDIIYFECSNTTDTSWWFIFAVEITDSFGSLTDPDTFGGTWDGIALTEPENITDTGVGTYEINVTAIFVPHGDPGKDLVLTATKADFGACTLTTEIAIDPDVKDIEIEEQPSKLGAGALPAGDDDDDDDEEIDIVVPVIIGVGAASAIGIAGIALYLRKRKR